MSFFNDGVSTKALVCGLGFVAGLLFGATGQKTRFCTMGGLADLVLMGDGRRFRAWVLAIAVALIGTQTLWSLGLIDLDGVLYRAPALGWAGAILGGLMFGYGMVLGGGCANRTLVRLGGGNLKSLVILLVIAATAAMTLRGLLALGRVGLETATALPLGGAQGLDALLGRATGLPAPALRWAWTALIAGGLAIWCLRDRAFRAAPDQVAAGLIVGALIPAGWWITGHVGVDAFDPTPLTSFTFIAPVSDTLMYLMTFTGSSLTFGIASVLGVIAGAFLTALATRSFRWESFSSVADMGASLIGAALMGVGGVLALGCTIGQGITGVSTLALGSFLALASILAGGWYALRVLEEGSHRALFRQILSRRPLSR